MRKITLSVIFAVIVFSGCNETFVSTTSDCQEISGKTFDTNDSTMVGNVKIRLTDFKGLEEAVDDTLGVSDSNGNFNISFCLGFKEIKEGNEITIYKFDSCTAMFSKTGYKDTIVTIKRSDTSYQSIKVFMKKADR